MSLPANWTLVPVIWPALFGHGGQPCNGTVVFSSAQIVTADGGTYVPAPISAAVVDGVMEAVSLPSTDDPSVSPTGWTWKVTPLLTPAGPEAFEITVPAAGGTVNLATVVPVEGPAQVSAVALADGALAQLFDNPTSAVAERLADAVAIPQAKADAAVPDVTTGLATYLYGNSYAILAAGYFTNGKHYSQQVADRLGSGAVTSYAVSGRRIADVLGTLLNGSALPGCSGIIAAGKWPGVSSRPGLLILESFINDMGHYPNMTGTAIPAAVTTAYRNALKVAYRAALAIMSSESRVEAASAAVTGAWTRAVNQPYASGGLLDFTTANAATATYTVTPPQTGPLAGKVYLLGFTVDPAAGTMAAQEIRVDGALQTSRTPAPWEQYVGNTGGQVNVCVDIVEVVLPIDGAAHAVEIRHVGSAGQLLYNDAVLIPSTDPNPIAVMGAEHTIPGTPVWSAAQTAVYTANNRAIAPDLKAVAAEFPHVFYVSSTMTANGVYSGDGIHPNDRGMQQRANDLLNAIRLSLPARLANKVLAALPNGNFPIV